MSTALGLAMQISANTAQLATAVQDVNKRLDEMGGAGKKAANDLSVLKNIEIARVFIDGIKLVSDGLLSAASSARRLFDDSRESIDQLGKLSQQTAISVEALQTYGAVADEAGVGAEAFAKSLRRLTVELGKADPSKDNAFKKIGLDVQELKQLKPEDVFLEVADALAGIANDAERAAAANTIFGKGGITLLPLINGGADALKRAADEAGRIGGVLTQDQVTQVEALNDRFTQVGKAIQGIINQVTAALAPALEGIAQQLLDVFNRYGGANIGKFIADSILKFADGFIGAIQSLVETVKIIGDGITKILANLGIDVRTEDQKRFEELERRANLSASLQGNQRGINPRARVSNQANLAALGGALSEQEAAELAKLRTRLSGSADFIQESLAQVRDSINRGRQLIDESYADRAAGLARTEVNVDVGPITDEELGAVDALSGIEEATLEQTNELREFRRELLSVTGRPADILGGA